MSNAALFPLGMDLDAPSIAQQEDHDTHPKGVAPEDQFTPRGQGLDRKDHFIEKNGIRCAGSHLIIDVHGAEHLDDCGHIEKTLVKCVEAAGATLLHIHLHRFEPNGVSGVAVLAESHISVHSWPENGYAAFDVFMCGDAMPERCVEVIRSAFKPDRIVVSEILRGQGA